MAYHAPRLGSQKSSYVYAWFEIALVEDENILDMCCRQLGELFARRATISIFHPCNSASSSFLRVAYIILRIFCYVAVRGETVRLGTEDESLLDRLVPSVVCDADDCMQRYLDLGRRGA
mmetsp:Transcript_2555/g.8036  ORF Transcript_2555/g.8036 Transcript_2555/m.8036 type:complete len:119 (+) Transcript_2555:373-729(+)